MFVFLGLALLFKDCQSGHNLGEKKSKILGGPGEGGQGEGGPMEDGLGQKKHEKHQEKTGTNTKEKRRNSGPRDGSEKFFIRNVTRNRERIEAEKNRKKRKRTKYSKTHEKTKQTEKTTKRLARPPPSPENEPDGKLHREWSVGSEKLNGWPGSIALRRRFCGLRAPCRSGARSSADQSTRVWSK